MKKTTNPVVSPVKKLTHSSSCKAGLDKTYRIDRTVMRTGSGEREISRTITPLGLCKKNTAKRSVAYSPVRIDKRTDRFYGELDRRLRKEGI